MKPMQGMLYHTMSARTCRLKAAFRQPDPIRLLTGWSMLGIMLGTWLAERMPETADCFLLTQGLMLSDAARTLGDVLRTALCPLLILLTGIWLSGFSAFGQPAAMLLLLSRGMAFGIAAGTCFMQYPLRKALCIAAILLLPYGLCSILLLCYAVRDALRLSNRMTCMLLRGQPPAEPADAPHDRLSAMLAILLLALLAAGMHTLLLWLFNQPLLT
ncbi:MAG: hypothetical protein IJM46_09205 [Oscillospiraceae bacterium]|nr:hypothetical protein [Oscillospiraceae bacterium]